MEHHQRLSVHDVDPAAYQAVLGLESDSGMVHLLMAIAVINVWNRLAVSTHQPLPDLDASPAGSES